MKPPQILLLFLALFFACDDGIERTKGQTLVEMHLNRIELFLTSSDTTDLFDPKASISFLEACTMIESEADRTTIGKLIPTEKDLQEWKNWYAVNANNIIWDQETKMLRVLK